MNLNRFNLVFLGALLCSACSNFEYSAQSRAIDNNIENSNEAQQDSTNQSLKTSADKTKNVTPLVLYEGLNPEATLIGPPAPESIANSEPQEKASSEKTLDPNDLSIWYYIRESNQITSATNRRIKAERDWYINNQDYLNRVFERAKPIIPYIAEEIRKRDLPMELILLPVIESAYNPYAYSRANASGLWQFIPSTGRLYKLRQDWWYDGRRDIIASTAAALDYLKYLSERHGNDWLLALAAYNGGTGKVGRAVARNKKYRKKADFWSLRLPRETQHYVPKFLALVDVVTQGHKYGVKLPNIDLHPRVAKVHLGDPIDLFLAAEYAETDMETFYWLNAGFKRWTTGEGKNFEILVPYGVQGRFTSKLASLPKSDRIQWAKYKIKPGDSLIRIAKRHQLTVNQIKKANQLKNANIRAGKTLQLPIGQTKTAASKTHHNPWQLAFEKRFKNIRIHRVKKGDSLWSISRRYGVSTNKIARWNNISKRSVLRIGQKLNIRPGSTSNQKKKSKQSGSKKEIKYRVKPGDSLHRIARTFNVSVPQITQWNTLKKNALIHPGQRLKLFVHHQNR